MTAFEAIKQITEERSRDGVTPLSAPFHLARQLSGLDIDEFVKQVEELVSMEVVFMQETINSYNLVLIENEM